MACGRLPGRRTIKRKCDAVWRVLERLNPLAGQERLGLSVAEADRLARVIERDFEFLPDSREVHHRYRSLLGAHNIQGVQVR